MRLRLILAALAWLLQLGLGVAQAAVPKIGVIETYPSGQSLMLPSNQDFYLHLAYETDQPIGIWITPYFHGKRVSAGTSPSVTYTGKGEALAWFFLSQPGLRVDEIRIRAGNGGYDMPVVATHRVDVTGGRPAMALNSPWAPEEPQWVARLRNKSTKQIEAEMHASRSATGPAAVLLFGGFMLIVPALGIAGLAAPIWTMRRWEGGWRLAAAVPLGLLVFVILRIAVDTSADPTSHNLWPFEILLTGFIGLGILAVLALMRRLIATGNSPG